MFKRLKCYKKTEAVKEIADLLARLAWLETQEADMEFTETTPLALAIDPRVYVRIYTSDRKIRLAEGIGDNMLEAINDVMEILRKQEALNGKS
jgi:hypothetical protein